MIFYNRKGKPIAYLDDGVHIFLFNGRPVAHLYENAVYCFNGEHVGWFENGWIRDIKGKCVFFTENATGSGPAKPAKYATPAKSAMSAKFAHATNSLTWSDFSDESFFC